MQDSRLFFRFGTRSKGESDTKRESPRTAVQLAVAATTGMVTVESTRMLPLYTRSTLTADPAGAAAVTASTKAWRKFAWVVAEAL